MSGLAPDEIERLAGLVDKAGWKWMRLRVGATELELGALPTSSPTRATATAPVREAAPVAPPPPPAAPNAQSCQEFVAVTAPHVGAFYRSPAPGEPPFIEIGQSVSRGDDIGLLEVMKLYTTIRATTAGVVREICVEDGVLVESGQALFLVEPQPASDDT